MSLTLDDYYYLKDVLEKAKITDPVVIRKDGRLQWMERTMKFKIERFLKDWKKYRMRLPQWHRWVYTEKLIEDKR